LIAPLGPADPVIAELGDDTPAAPLRRRGQLPPLVVNGLIPRADAKVQGNSLRFFSHADPCLKRTSLLDIPVTDLETQQNRHTREPIFRGFSGQPYSAARRLSRTAIAASSLSPL
jgi:hypothetical protein